MKRLSHVYFTSGTGPKSLIYRQISQVRQIQSDTTNALQQPRPLEGKLALITGSSRGIGAAIARKLASNGASILLNYASKSSDQLALDSASELEEAFCVKVVPVRADVSTNDGCSSIISSMKKNFSNPRSGRPQIDILVNNAGIAISDPLSSVTPESFQKVYTVNVLGPILITKACIPYLPQDRSGRIVNISSIGASMGLEEQTVYGGSKGALESMTRTWARELAENATVNAVNPGAVMSELLMTVPDHILEKLARWDALTPLSAIRADDTKIMRRYGEKFGGGRPAYDWEVAGTVAMLCSPEARWTTGSVISANGGLRFSV